MRGCCKSAPTPHVILASDCPSMPASVDSQDAARISGKLLEGTPPPVAPTLLRDLRAQLKDLGDRQEEFGNRQEEFGNRQAEFFRRLLEKQKHLEDQFMMVQSASKANANVQDAFQQTQEIFLAEFREFLSTANKNGKEVHTIGQSGAGGFMAGMKFEAEKEHIMSEKNKRTSILNEIEEVGRFSQHHHHQVQFVQKAANVPSRSTASGSHHSGLQLHHQRTRIDTSDQTHLSRFKYFLKCKEFELAIAFAIITNAFIMCWECQYLGLAVGYNLKDPGRDAKADVVWAGAETTFTCFDWFFGLLFLIEMIAKLICWRQQYFYDSESLDVSRETSPCWKVLYQICSNRLQGWNLLDFFCVSAFLFDKMAAVSAINPQMLRLLRLFRLFRLIRLLRFLETLDHLYVMTTAISGLSKVLTWAIILLTILLLICNLFLVQILQATYFNGVAASDLDEEGLRMHHKMYEYFGTCTRCMLSMYEITLGNWPPVARLLSEEVSQWFTFFCVVHKLTIGFAVIGVITGVILQETFKVAQTDDIIMFRQKKNASRILKQKMKVLFETLDSEGDGRIQVSEFMKIANDPEIKLWLASLDIETDDLNTLFSLIDTDRSGYIELDELVARMPRIKGSARSIDMLAMLQFFRTGSCTAVSHSREF